MQSHFSVGTRACLDGHMLRLSWRSTRVDKSPRQNLQLTAYATVPHVPGCVWLPWSSLLLFLAGCGLAAGPSLCDVAGACSVVGMFHTLCFAEAQCVAFCFGAPNPFNATLHYSSSNTAAKTSLHGCGPTPHERSFVACLFGRPECCAQCTALQMRCAARAPPSPLCVLRMQLTQP